MNFALITLLLLVPHRVAVLTFDDATHEDSIAWMGTSLAETLSTHFAHIQEFRVVERPRLNLVLGELKFGRSQYVDPATAVKIGHEVQADTVVVGSFQKLGDRIRITARFVDVTTGIARAPAMVDGRLVDFFDLQIELAKRLAGAEAD